MAMSIQERTWRERMALKRSQFLVNRVKDQRINNALKSLQHKTEGAWRQPIKKVQSTFFGFAPGSPFNKRYQKWRRTAGGKSLKYLKKDAQGNLILDPETGAPKFTQEGLEAHQARRSAAVQARGRSTRSSIGARRGERGAPKADYSVKDPAPKGRSLGIRTSTFSFGAVRR